MKIRQIKTNADYRAALKRIDKLWGFPADTERGNELDVLITLVDEYENEHFPIRPPDLISAIKFRMEQMQMKQAELAPVLGGPNRASEILNGKRYMTVKMILALHEKLRIPVESLAGTK